jgi:hypothetical protein
MYRRTRTRGEMRAPKLDRERERGLVAHSPAFIKLNAPREPQFNYVSEKCSQGKNKSVAGGGRFATSFPNARAEIRAG